MCVRACVCVCVRVYTHVCARMCAHRCLAHLLPTSPSSVSVLAATWPSEKVCTDRNLHGVSMVYAAVRSGAGAKLARVGGHWALLELRHGQKPARPA